MVIIIKRALRLPRTAILLIVRSLAVCLALAVWPVTAAESTSLLDILQEELQRNFEVLSKKADPAVYYLSYAITEQESHGISATLGAIQSNNQNRQRRLDIMLRAGSRELDNYRSIRGDLPRFTRGVQIALDDNPNAIRRTVWEETDRIYRLAAQRLINIRTNQEVVVAAQEASNDFSTEDRSVFSELLPPLKFTTSQWLDRMRTLSAEFRKYPRLLNSGLSVSAMREAKYLVNTEGTRIEHGRVFSRVILSAQAKAEDGMDLTTSDSFEAAEPSKLPDDGKIRSAIDRVATDLTNLLDAPTVEPYVGPAILSGRAAGVFFHEIFGHRVEGHRLKDDSDGQTFAKSVGTPVLPSFLSVVFDPTRRAAGSEDLNGWYHFDDEGVKARPVTVVEQGILKTFLMSRTPIPGVDLSNGHGRRQVGSEPVSRQSNLVVESASAVPEDKLRALLIDELKQRNKPHGYYFQDITGGFTQTGRRGIQSFKVMPLVVYRVYADGRPDELVRGADIVGTPLASFAKILATGDRLQVFNGFCGAESGSVPVSAVAPAILVSELEVQKKDVSRDRPPQLPPPPAAPTSVSGGAR
jgi:TldD protein